MPQENQAADAGYYLGFDGGGTKTDCILVDAAGAVLARATAGPSNPLRAGYAKAWFTLSDAADAVLERHNIKADNIFGICAGIGGAGRESVAKRIATFLERGFPNAAVSVTTDLAITLQAAVGDGEGIILVVGTGSGAYGRDEKTALSEQVLEWLGCKDWNRVLDWVVKNPDDVFPRMFPLVAAFGDKGDPVAREILSSAAESLAELASSVLKKLKMADREVPVAKAGGALGRSKLFDAAIDAGLERVAPRARVVTLQEKPAEAAAQLAIRLGRQKAHAG